MTNALLVTVGNFYVIYTHFSEVNREGLQFTHIFIFVVGSVFAINLSIVSYIVSRGRVDVRNGFNALDQLNRQMKRSMHCKFLSQLTKLIIFNTFVFSMALEFRRWKFKQNSRPDFIGLMMITLSICLSTPAPLVVLFVVFGRFDIVTFIASDVLSAELLQRVHVKLILYLVRFWMLGLCIPVLLRTIVFLLWLGAVALVNGLECLGFVSEMRDLTSFLSFYAQLHLIIKCFHSMLADVLLVLTTVVFWGLVAAVVVLVQGYHLLNPFVYGGLAGGIVICVVILAFIMRVFGQGLNVQEEMLRRRKREGKELYIERKTRVAKANMKRMAALFPIEVWYGEFFSFSVEFHVGLVRNLVDRVVDAVLMFDLRLLNA